MKILETILMPFVTLYRVVTSPFRKKEVKTVNTAQNVNVFTSKTNEKPVGPVDVFDPNKKLTEIKPGEQILEKKEVRSAYSTPNKPKEEIDPVRLAQKKQIESLKKQDDYNKLLEKIRLQEMQRASEQEKIRLEREAIAQRKIDKQLAKQEEEQKRLEEREKQLQEKIKNGEPVSFSEKIKRWRKKINYDPKKELELEARKEVLLEQFKDLESTSSRLSKPLLFKYLARTASGELETSYIEALSRVDVYSFLMAEGYEVYEINAVKPHMFNTENFKFSKTRLIFYLSQLSAYLKSGIALADAVKILDDQANKVNEKRAWRAVYYDLSNGEVLSNAMEKRGDLFPKLLINMIKTAEMTGNLIETLDDMVEYYTESEQTRKQMKSAMTYPAVVSLFATVVVIFILMWVVPQFVGIYSDLGSDIPAITKVVIAISDFLQNYLIWLILGIGILVVIFIYLYKNIINFKRKVQEFAMHLPIFGNIIIYNEVNIFTKTFANLINHNVFITDSMDILRKITSNEIYKKLVYDTVLNLTKGEPISKAFKDQWAFPNIAYQMLITGEKTGRLGPMMERVSSYYQEQHRNIIDQMKSLIEPVLIISLAVIVGGILLAVIIPMYGMYDAL